MVKSGNCYTCDKLTFLSDAIHFEVHNYMKSSFPKRDKRHLKKK